MPRTLAATAITVAALVALVAAPAAAAPRAHVVQPGETLYRIALRYNLSVETLARANGLSDPARIRVGQRLLIPEGEPQGQGAPASRPHADTPRPRQVAHPTYTVRPGDTLSSIAQRYGTTVRALIDVNQLSSDILQIGQLLRIPSMTLSRGPAHSALPQSMPGIAWRPVEPTGERVPPQFVVGMEVNAPRPIRVRPGPKTYLTTLALLSAGTPLRIVDLVPGWYQVQLPDEEVGWVREEDFRPADQAASAVPQGLLRGTEIVHEAMGYVGIPYVWGGQSPGGVDCSGFVYIVFAPHLPSLGRMNSFAYFQVGIPVDRADLQPGDLVFFTTYAPGASHVGIYLGEGKFIQASSASRRVTITSLDDPYYAARYLGARRLLKP